MNLAQQALEGAALLLGKKPFYATLALATGVSRTTARKWCLDLAEPSPKNREKLTKLAQYRVRRQHLDYWAKQGLRL